MKIAEFIDSNSLQHAFIANFLNQLADLISDQGEAFLAAGGIDLPSRATSAVLLIEELDECSVADLAKALDHPHQLVIQRVDVLVSLGLIKKVGDPNDGRRKILKLTTKGQQQLEGLKQKLGVAETIFRKLFAEIGCDIIDVLDRIKFELLETSLLERSETAK